MAALYWIVRVYKYYLIAWVLLSWIPGVGDSDLYALLGIAAWPAMAPFSFLAAGPVSFAAIIPIYLLNMLERYLAKQAGIVTVRQSSAQNAVVDPRDFQRAPNLAPPPGDNTPPGSNIGI